MSKKIDELSREFGRRGGKALFDKLGKSYMAELGRKGGIKSGYIRRRKAVDKPLDTNRAVV